MGPILYRRVLKEITAIGGLCTLYLLLRVRYPPVKHCLAMMSNWRCTMVFVSRCEQLTDRVSVLAESPSLKVDGRTPHEIIQI